MADEKIISDNESYAKGEDKMSYRDIVLRQFQKVITNSSKEMRKGFWVKSPPTGSYGGGDKIKYVGDSRRELMRSIDVLHDILQPKFDTEMKEKSKEILPKIQKIHNYQGKEGDDLGEILGKKFKALLIRYRQLFQNICFFLERQAWFVTEETTD